MRLSSELSVRLDYLKHNIDLVRSVSNSCDILFMVKANAYGHGVCEVVRYCYEECGIKEFGVATLGEALYLRENLPEVFCDLYVFSDHELRRKEYYRYYIDQRLIPVVTSMGELDFILTHQELAHLPLCLKFNTGMNRLGFEENEVEEVAKKLNNSKRSIHHLMTHMACAGQSMTKNKRNLRQKESFASLKNNFKKFGVPIEKTSIANSGMIEQGEGFDETHVRPGLLLYGASSLKPDLAHKSLCLGKNISCLKTEVLHTFSVTQGQPIGYGATPVASKGVIAIVALGYGDGINQSYKGATIHYKDEVGHVVGRVNMDMTYILFPENSTIEVGEVIHIWDEQSDSIARLSTETKTSAYELFSQITARVPRSYHIN